MAKMTCEEKIAYLTGIKNTLEFCERSITREWEGVIEVYNRCHDEPIGYDKPYRELTEKEMQEIRDYCSWNADEVRNYYLNIHGYQQIISDLEKLI